MAVSWTSCLSRSNKLINKKFDYIPKYTIYNSKGAGVKGWLDRTIRRS